MAKNIVIVGLGKTGISCARHLKHKGISFTINDSRQTPPELEHLKNEMPDIPLSLGQFDEHLLLSADVVIVSQGVSLFEPCLQKCRQAGIPLIGDIELFANATKTPCAGITGSNGKSTVTTLVGEMAKKAGVDVRVGGNLGPPALDLLADDDPQLYVLELSNFQLEVTSSLALDVGCILNLSPDHLDRYASYSDYVMAKQRIYQHCKVAVYNRNDNLTFVQNAQPKHRVSFGMDEPEEGQFGLRQHKNAWFLACGGENILPVKEMKIRGRQNWNNALAALAIGRGLSLPLNAMLETLREFRGLRHRCEWVADLKGIEFYNDSKGTNIGATLAAIEGIGPTLSGKIILLAGGLGKGADFTQLSGPVSRYVKTAVLYGQDATIIKKAWASTPACLLDAKTFQEAFQTAVKQAQPGDAILLSPACASWDMFNNFEHRGDVFCDLVKDLKNAAA